MLDTKSKTRTVRIFLTIIGILSVTAVVMLLLPGVNKRAQEMLAGREEHNEDKLYSALSEIYAGCYVMYYEIINPVEGQSVTEVFENGEWIAEWEEKGKNELPEGLEEEEISYRLDNYRNFINEKFDEWKTNYEEFRDNIEYYACLGETGYVTNSVEPIDEVLKQEKMEIQTKEELQRLYAEYFILNFDENGRFSVTPVYHSNIDAGDLVRLFGKIDREKLKLYEAAASYDLFFADMNQKNLILPPKNMQVVIAVPSNSAAEEVFGISHGPSYWASYSAYGDSGAGVLYFGAFVVLLLFLCFMTSSHIWKSGVSMKRPGCLYLFEISVIGIICMGFSYDLFYDMVTEWAYYTSVGDIFHLFQSGEYAAKMDYCLACGLLLLLFSLWYLFIRMLRPVFSLGLWNYLKEYSLAVQGLLFLKKLWGRFMRRLCRLKREAEQIDLKEDGTKTIVKIVLLNFPILALTACCWFFGIFIFAVYSVVLFVLLERCYQKIRGDYNCLLDGMKQIEDGDFNVAFPESLGSFEPIKEELFVLQDGLKNAVEKELKSERMKTELITNVSHDLKTPLTAITTYVELLKKEDITEEERRSYIEILEKKSFRLKVLIEDLFEVSKASSNNISLRLVDVDVVNLLKQVSVEHEERFAAAGLKLRFDVPGEKVTVSLDSAKTYRIFENLFANVGKYAMEGSRVYVTVKTGTQVEISIKNMSAEELHIKPEELTERFVRGDISRNTEGSGLGLAIAKSFTEAQGGTFRLEVDGDLFKVTICFPPKIVVADRGAFT